MPLIPIAILAATVGVALVVTRVVHKALKREDKK